MLAGEEGSLSVQPPSAQIGWSWTRLITAFFLAWASLSLLSAAHADTTAKSSAHADISQGFARIVFDLGEDTKVDAVINFSVLVAKFSNPITIDREQLTTELGPYISIIRQDPDGATVRFALRGPLRLVKSTVGRQTAIDLIPPRYKGEPPPFHGLVAQAPGIQAAAAAPLIPPSEAAERKEFANFASPAALDLLPIRVGLNPTYTRLAFDWPVPVDYTVERHGTDAVVRFSRSARVDMAQLKTDPPKYVKDVASEILDGKLSIILTLAPDIDVQDFRDNQRIVLDLTPKSPSTGVAVSALGDDASAYGPPKPVKPVQQASEAAVGGDAQAVLTGRSSEPPLPKAAPEPAIAKPDPTAEQPMAPPGQSNHVGINSDGKGVTLAVAFSEAPPAAIFRYGDVLWLVFDSDQPLSADPIAREAAPFIDNIALNAEDGAQIVRVQLKTDALIEAKAEGNAWSVHVADTANTPGAVIAITRENPPSGQPQLRLKGDTAKLHWLSNPALGDFILVGTAQGPIRNVPIERQFVEMSALATAHGIAITPLTENLSARIENGDVVIDTEGGLALTVSDTIERGSTRSPIERVQDPAFMDFKTWRRGGAANFIATRQALLNAVLRANDKSRNLARLELARYYVANGFAAEAIGELKLMAKDDPRVENAAAFHALRGVAEFMMERIADAEKDFGDGSLATERDISVWRAAAAAKARRWDAAADGFATADAVIARYQPLWQAQFRLLSTLTSLERNDVSNAQKAYSAVPPQGLTPKLKPMHDYLGGKLLEAQGRGDEALARYTLAASGSRGEAQARARLAEADLAVRLGKKDQKAAIESLERLHYDWRGDSLELDVLGMLGRHYVAARRFRDGLGVMHAAVSYFPKEVGTRAIQQQMDDTFRGLFLEGGADALAPIEALALYYDYRELTPIGTDGDEMVRRLAERLVLVDLLPQAADLLQHQVDNRLQGVARAQVASRLAAVYLMDHKPEPALKSIRSTRQAQLPAWLEDERRLLEARSLLELKQYDFALEVLVNDMSQDAARIRADVYWGANNWGQAAEHIEQVLTDRWRKSDVLSSDERLDVMRAAISYLFNNDGFGLSSLRDRYGALMKGTEDAAAFDLVTAKPDIGNADVGELAKRLAAADTLDAFMKAFKAHYAAREQSAAAAAVPPASATN